MDVRSGITSPGSKLAKVGSHTNVRCRQIETLDSGTIFLICPFQVRVPQVLPRLEVLSQPLRGIHNLRCARPLRGLHARV